MVASAYFVLLVKKDRGEAYDKTARILGLPYPGGLPIDQLAQKGDPEAIRFPRALPGADNFDWSFSGLKTAVAQHVRKHGVPEGQALADLCASFLAERQVAGKEKGREDLVHVLLNHHEFVTVR